MAQHKYSYPKYDKESMARSVGTDLPISTKQTLEICNMIRGKSLARAKTMLNDVIKMDMPVPFKRFTNGVGHRKGNLASGRYPIKASASILSVLESAETNAQQKGINTSRLGIVHLAAQKGSRPMRGGRHRGRMAKRSHVEVVLAEVEEKPKKRSKRTTNSSKEVPSIEKKPAHKAPEKKSEDKKEGDLKKDKETSKEKPEHDTTSKGGEKK
ncbi:MAG: 50S ribosomal protein L22 [Nanoarchaeota archaeon]|nr:50S ribosomal protein L22 [Nanoarchaeota archaeon]